ncbi:hypothetical protein STANM309S_00581 [Streptomyces tanashiensis]
MLIGVWTTTPRTVRNRLSQRLFTITGSSSSRLQLSRPTNSGEPRPFQRVKDSTTTRTSGTRANRPKKTAAGAAQAKPGRPTPVEERLDRPRRTLLSVLSTVGTAAVVMSGVPEVGPRVRPRAGSAWRR